MMSDDRHGQEVPQGSFGGAQTRVGSLAVLATAAPLLSGLNNQFHQLAQMLTVSKAMGRTLVLPRMQRVLKQASTVSMSLVLDVPYLQRCVCFKSHLTHCDISGGRR